MSEVFENVRLDSLERPNFFSIEPNFTFRNVRLRESELKTFYIDSPYLFI